MVSKRNHYIEIKTLKLQSESCLCVTFFKTPIYVEALFVAAGQAVPPQVFSVYIHMFSTLCLHLCV